MYTPTKHPVTAFKATVRLAFQQAYKGPPLTGPLRCDLDFFFPRTAALTWKKREMPRSWHAKKPDRDNCDKSVMDALKGLAWIDDAQVCDGRIRKGIAAGDEQPHVVVTITELGLWEED
jgi:Holliday junction resolvase RusA-like endonuclease